ncbi:hypothetical protein IFM89_008514 [Coptis chinensis]|uniref:Uncharacterized protein n=1 Tax=Coptis chinensis TaxID=261450 RepID=A0A835HNW7_9MAGN|nr:hypothetical protein IFM89_008514 [Coptis chinensis]
MVAANAPITMKEALTPNMVYLLGEQLVNEEGVGSLVWGGVDLSTSEAISGIFNSTLATTGCPQLPSAILESRRIGFQYPGACSGRKANRGDGIDRAEKIVAMVKAANVQVEAYWQGLFAKLVQKKNIEDMIMNGSSGGGGALLPILCIYSLFAFAPAGKGRKSQRRKVMTNHHFSIFFINLELHSLPVYVIPQFCKFRF